MRQYIFLLIFSVALLQSCTKDFGSVEVTYTKATAIYGDLESIRTMPLLDAPKTIEEPGKIFVSRDFLLIGEEEKGIHLIDNSDPENPTSIRFINILGNREFYVEGSYLYAESYYDMLKIDLTNINEPVLDTRLESVFGEALTNNQGATLIGFDFEKITEKVDLDSEINQQSLGGEEIFYFDYAQNLIPPSAVPASFAGNSSQAIGSVNRIAYAKDHLYVISRVNLSTFEDHGNFALLSSNPIGNDMETIYPDNDKLFIGSRTSMMVMDIADPATPSFVSSFQHINSCDPVYPNGDVAYLTLRTGDFSDCPGDVNALYTLDLTNIQQPQQIQEIEMESPYGMSLIGEKLYVGEGVNGLKVFNASNKRQLVLENWDKSVEAYDIIQHPTRTDLVLIASTNGLAQYKVENGDLSLMSRLQY